MNRSTELFQRDADAVSDVMKLRFYPMVAKTAGGALIRDVDGREYLDFSAGWGVANTGYGHPRIVDAVYKEMNRLSFSPTISVLNEESIELAERLRGMIPGDFEKAVWYGHSGSDANEFLYKMIPAATGRSRIVSFVGSYHGQTMGSYSMSGHPAQGKFTGGGNVTKIPYPYCYRCPFERDRETCGLFCLKYVEDFVFDSQVSPDQVGALVAEAVQCDGGDVVPPDGYLQGLERLCRKYGILFVLDEVKIGFGRTGKMFGFENWNVTPDAVVMAKPMGSGQPISAVTGKKELMDAGVGMHMFTTAGNPVACAASLATIDVIEEEKLAENAEAQGEYLLGRLRELQACCPAIGDVRGKGLVIGVELVEDTETKKPASELAALVVYRCYELGLLLYDSGISANVIELTPPLIITKQQCDRAVEVLRQAIEDALTGRIVREDLGDFAGWG